MKHRTIATVACGIAALGLTACGTSSTSASAPATTSSADAGDSTGTTATAAGLSCADIGGVFVPHGTDGRRDCEPANPDPKCHLPAAQQDSNYVAVMTLDPPFPNGVVENPEVLQLPMSNAECWKVPSSGQ